MVELNEREYPTLTQTVDWEIVKAQFSLAHSVDERLTSNVSIIPSVGDKYVIIQIENGRWELPGGTLEKGEGYLEALKREVLEELGGELISYQVFGKFDCQSMAEKPFRPHIPHPHFIRIVGYGEVELIGKPLNPVDGEQVVVVDLVDIETAVERFTQTGRFDIAELYRLAHRMKSGEMESNLNQHV